MFPKPPEESTAFYAIGNFIYYSWKVIKWVGIGLFFIGIIIVAISIASYLGLYVVIIGIGLYWIISTAIANGIRKGKN